MKPILILLTSLAPIVSHAQEWDLFPLGQRSYYHHTAGWYGPAVSLHLMDSVKQTPDGDVLYFRRAMGIPGAGGCMDEILAAEIFTEVPDPNPIDSLVSRNDTIFYHHHEVNEPFYFLPKAVVGQSWIITSSYPGNGYDQITITCTAIAEETFLGITDSVKTFTMEANGTLAGQTPVSDFQFRLSKHHGLLELVPFRSFLIHPASLDFVAMPLVGLERDGEAHGFRQPRFHDYFHLSVGDILVWRRDFNPGSWQDPGWTRYYRDSITSVSITADTVRYTLDRITEMETGEIVYSLGQQRIFTHAHYGTAVENATYWFAIGIMGIEPFEGMIWSNGPMLLSQHPVTMDTVVRMAFAAGNHAVWLDGCEVADVFDLGDHYELNTIAGVVKRCQYMSQDVDCQELIAWRIDGITYNDISLNTARLPAAQDRLFVHPNPVRDVLYVSGMEALSPVPYRISDTLGARVAEGVFNGGPIDVASLPRGLYLLHLGEGKPVRFIKE
jgi:hypothetical protein